MDPVKEAFSKVKEDIQDLKLQFELLQHQINEIQHTLSRLSREDLIRQTVSQTIQHISQSNTSQNQADLTRKNPYNPQNNGLYGLKSPNNQFSTRNRGVPTDRQSDSQTNRHPNISHGNGYITPQESKNLVKSSFNYNTYSSNNKVSEVLNSLDNMKKEIRMQFKHLTNQEMLIFSNIYQLEDQGLIVDYSLLASKLGLSESSIRDYTHKIIKKGIPLIKVKENNKKVTLLINPDLKKIASLSTIISLRDL